MPRLAELLMGFQGPTSYAVVFLILLACGFGVPIPEDITLIAAGVLAYAKAANVWGMIGVGMAGVLVGDSAMFLLGRRYGLALAKRPFVARILPEDRLERVSEVLNKRGNKILFAARFMPGLRSPLFFTAGALGVPMRVFLFFDGMAALLSVPAIVYSVYYFGDRMEEVIAAIQRANHGIVAVIVLLVVAAVVKVRLGKRRAAAVKPKEAGPTESDAA
jgi:membrane protein DedA with SNARE-associated domain